MKIIIQVFLLVSFSIVWSEAASHKNSTDSSSQSVPPEPKHAPPPPPPQTAPPPIPQSQQSQSSVDFSSKAIPAHPERSAPQPPSQHSQQSQHSQSQDSYESWANFSVRQANEDERQSFNNDEQPHTHTYLSYPESIKKSLVDGFASADIDRTIYGSEPQNFSDYGPSRVLTIVQIMEWHRKMSDDPWEIQSELVKIGKIGRAPEFQPFLNILKCADSIRPNETVISNVFPAELRAKFTDLNDFDKRFISKYQYEVDTLIRENQRLKGRYTTWHENYKLTLKYMRIWIEAQKKISVEFAKSINRRLYEICGKCRMMINTAIIELQVEKSDIEDKIKQLNELVKHCEDKFKIACDTNDKKRAALVDDFHKSLNVLATKKVPFLQKVNGIHEKIATVFGMLDDLDKKRYSLHRQFETYFVRFDDDA